MRRCAFSPPDLSPRFRISDALATRGSASREAAPLIRSLCARRMRLPAIPRTPELSKLRTPVPHWQSMRKARAWLLQGPTPRLRFSPAWMRPAAGRSRPCEASACSAGRSCGSARSFAAPCSTLQSRAVLRSSPFLAAYRHTCAAASEAGRGARWSRATGCRCASTACESTRNSDSRALIWRCRPACA